MTRRKAEVAIVGAGAIGCALARELAGRGASVIVIEKTQPGAEASGAAAGMLAPQAEGLGPGPFFDLALESRRLYPRWALELAEETGIDVGYRRTGILRCALPGDAEEFDAYRWQQENGLAIEPKDPEEIAALTSGSVSREIEEAIFFPEEAIVNNPRLTRALWLAAERRGVTFASENAARRFVIRGGRCVGVETEESVIEALHVINAAGAWAGFDPGLPLPVEPVRGQIVELEAPVPGLSTVVESGDVYVVPREGSWLLGSTVERVGFEKRVTGGAVEKLIAAAARLLPSVERASFRGAWSGLRPGTPDGLPLLGHGPVSGLFLATGHFRNGILLAPITALLLADVLAGKCSRDLTPFSIERFARDPAPEGVFQRGLPAL